MKRYIRKGASVLKHEGPLSLTIKSLQKVQRDKSRRVNKKSAKIKFVSLVAIDDAMKANWSENPYIPSKKSGRSSKTVNWVMSPPGGGGGHQNIFRFIEYLDRQGYKNNVYIYSNVDYMTIAQAKENVSAYCKADNLTFYRYKGTMVDSNIVFATGWETAYPVFNDKTSARKMYFVQDFEPYFYPIGSDYVLAENTYKFGFSGITAGGWLSHKLSESYGMKCDYYDFGADPSLYKLRNQGERKKVFFYARPVTTRRGFELGIMALTKFHELAPDYEIVLAGWDVSGYDIPFPYINLKALPLSELSNVYNECAAALVISLTNMSLLPLELLACGTIPVVNNGPNNTMVSSNQYIHYAEASPETLAIALQEAVERKNLPGYAAEAARSVESLSWEKSCQKFEEIIKGELSG